MALWEKASGAPGFEKLNVHAFCAALREMVRGGMTRAELLVAFPALDAGDIAELDKIKAAFDSSGDKNDFVQRIETVLILSEYGAYNKAKAQARLGFA